MPQFHTFKENEEWHGRGFTEWTNVTKMMPQFLGHYQPHLPIDVGFYDLSTTAPFYRQIELAKNYGIYGFCFYYYWFQGKKIMHKPVYNYLNDKKLDFPFCLCWAVESWNKVWDGGNNEEVIKSQLCENDIDLFWKDLLPFLKDERYIKINDKPALLIYKPLQFNEDILSNFIKELREKAKLEKFKNIYLMWCLTNDCSSTDIDVNHKMKKIGFDACVEFPPHGLRDNVNTEKNVPLAKIKGYINPEFSCRIFDMKSYILNGKHIEPVIKNINCYRTVFPMWDNSARQAHKGGMVFYGSTPELYKTWLKDMCIWTANHRPKSENYVFINAWNEWAEGAHLEPDRNNGYAYLEKTREVIDEGI